jgi:Uma2 family endonuclease
MTTVDDRRMTEFFESIEAPEGIKAELLRGEIVMTTGLDLVHNLIVESVQDAIPRDRWRRLTTQTIDILGEASEPQPDLVVLERDVAPASGRLLPVTLVTLLVEVVSKTSRLRDHVTKRSIYAAGGVPAYLIIDPFAAKCVMLTEPGGAGEQADYRAERTSKFGEPVPVDVLGMMLETSDVGTLPDVTRGQ